MPFDAVTEAERVLANRRWFATTDARCDEFLCLRNSPLLSPSKSDRLFSRPSRFSPMASEFTAPRMLARNDLCSPCAALASLPAAALYELRDLTDEVA